MKKILILLAASLAAAFAACAQTNSSVESVPPASMAGATNNPSASGVDFTPELAAVTAQLKAKFDAGQTTGEKLGPTRRAITALIVKYAKEGNREQLARLYLLDAHIYADGLHAPARARAIWQLVVQNYPHTVAAQGARISLARLNAQKASDPDPSIPEGLDVGQKFPDFAVMDLAGKAQSVAAHRGHLTMIDFWATWCPPCRGEMPNVIATYNRYHAQGFDIIGVSLDSDRASVLNFTADQGMPWPQFFDGQAWNNALAVKYDVKSIPMDYLLDTHGVIIGKELRGDDLPAAVAKALAGE